MDYDTQALIALSFKLIFGPLALLGLLELPFEVRRFRTWWRSVRVKLPVENQWGFRVGRYERWEMPGLQWVQIVLLVIAIVLSILSYVLAPKPKAPKPDSTKDLQDPTAQAGMPVPVVFGTMIYKGLNCLWFGDKRKIRYKVSPP